MLEQRENQHATFPLPVQFAANRDCVKSPGLGGFSLLFVAHNLVPRVLHSSSTDLQHKFTIKNELIHLCHIRTIHDKTWLTISKNLGRGRQKLSVKEELV